MAELSSIYEFACKWLNKFNDPETKYIDLLDHYMADDCDNLGFDMDCGKAFSEKYSGAFNDYQLLEQIIDDVTDIALLGSAIYSKWRYFNHWAYSGAEILEPNNKAWFIISLERIKSLSHENTKEPEAQNCFNTICR